MSDTKSNVGTAQVNSIRDVVAEYRFHPEFKSEGGDGQPCGKRTAGLLGRRHVELTGAPTLIGKESNRLEDVQAGLIGDWSEVGNEYHDPHEWESTVLPVLRAIPLGQLSERSGLHPSTLKRIRAGRSRPRGRNVAILAGIAEQYARERLATMEVGSPSDGLAALRLFCERVRSQTRACPVCGKPVESPRAKYCSAKCRKRSERRRETACT